MAGKGKGSSFERDISKFITKFWQGKERPYLFWRSPASGGLGTIYTENDALKGDIIPLTDETKKHWPFVIECKVGYPKTSFWQHFNSTKFGLEDFWVQCVNECPNDKYPMLIYRKKGRKEILGITKAIKDNLNNKLLHLNYTIMCWNGKSDDKGILKSIPDCYLYDMKSFFESITVDDIKKIKEGI